MIFLLSNDFYTFSYILLIADNRIKRKFNLERVGQYLQNQNLQNPSRLGITSDWNKLLEQNECLKNSACIYPHHKEMSLVQEHSNLKKSVQKLFTKPDEMISLKFDLLYCIDVSNLSNGANVHLHDIEVDDIGSIMFSASINNDWMYLIKFTPKSDFIKYAKYEFVQEEQKYSELKLCHSQFYNSETLSMLLEYRLKDHQKTNGFIQFPIQTFESRMLGSRLRSQIFLCELDAINLCNLMDFNLMRKLDINDGCLVAVSGGRKMSTILSKSKRKLRHYEMEVDEEDMDMDQDVDDNSRKNVAEFDDNENGDNEIEMNDKSVQHKSSSSSNSSGNKSSTTISSNFGGRSSQDDS